MCQIINFRDFYIFASLFLSAAIGKADSFQNQYRLGGCMDTSYTIKRIVIDAGHGGKDSGCIGVSKTQEKDITLKIALALGAKIKSKFPHIKVIYTRHEDVFIPLDERANIANRNRADLFISIHCNYIPNYPEYHGSETYVLGLERSKANLAVAKRENQSILMEDNYSARYAANIWDSPEGNILLTAWQSSYLTRSMHIAEKVETELSNTAERKSHGVKQAGFLVLRQTTMPSILVETGFLSNEDEELYLNSKEGQEKESSALFNAFCQYKNEVENKNRMLVIKENISPRENSSTEQVRIVEIANSTKKDKVTKSTAISYKVQVASSPFKLETSNSEKWNLTKEVEIRKENDLYKYLVVGYKSYESAVSDARRLSKVGFEGAFVCAYEGDNRIDIKTAKEKSAK